MDTQKLIKDFISYLKRKGKTKSTLIAYENDILQLAESNLNKELMNYSETDIKHGLQFLQTSKSLSAKTISRKLNSTRTFYKYLLEKKLIKVNPAARISHPKFRAKKQRFLTKMEYLALREVSRENDRLFTMIDLLLQTGIRIGELSRLKIKDIKLNSSKSTIFVEKFGSCNERTVYLNDKITNELKSFLAKQKHKDNAPLFSTKTGRSIEVRNIRGSIDRAIIKAKLKNACVNDLRNTFIFYQLSNGLSLSKLAEIVGHKNINTTTRYLELLPKKYKPNGNDSIVEL